MFILNFVLVVKFYGLCDFLTNKIITHHSTMILHFLCNHNRRHKILCNHNRRHKIFVQVIMPYSLRQLESQRDNYVKNIQELRASAEDKGAESIGDIAFNPIHFFNTLNQETSQRIDMFLSFFPSLPEILELQRKAAREEKKKEENVK